MVSPTQVPPGAAAVSATGAEAMPEPGPSQAVITKVTNATDKLKTVTAKHPNEAEKQAAAVRFGERLQDARTRFDLDEVATETKSPQKVQQLPPQGALHLLETIGALGADIPDWLKDQIDAVQDLLVARALTPQVTLSEAESASPSLNILLAEMNKMLETPWDKMNAKAAKEFCGFLTRHSYFIGCCDPRSQDLIRFYQNKIEDRFLVQQSQQALTRYSADFAAYLTAPELTQAPLEAEGERLCSYAYTLVAAHKSGLIDLTSFETKWADVKAKLDTRGLSAMLRYEMAFCFGLMGICGEGYEASKNKEPETSLLQVLEYATRNAGALTE